MSLRLTFLSLLFFVQLSAQSSEHLTITAKSGDGILKILREYDLEHSSCNKAHFYELNHLKIGDYLKKGVTYQLPVYVFTFNGKTIRSTLGVKDYEQAKKIQDYNDALTRSKVKKGDFRKTKELWVPYHLFVCPEMVEPALTPNNRVFPIFGKQHEKVPLKSNALQGKVYYIVAGHGGPDPGAVNRTTGKKICEDEYAYDVALRLTRNLVEHGATAYMIIRDENDGIRSGSYLAYDKDEVCWPNLAIPLGQKRRLFQRSNAINALYNYHKHKGAKEQYAIMIHIDSRRHNRRIDVYFYHHPNSSEGKNLAEDLQTVFRQKYATYQKGRGYNGAVKARDLHMLRETKPTSVYLELGNLNNSSDLQRFLKESNRQAVANWIFEGLK